MTLSLQCPLINLAISPLMALQVTHEQFVELARLNRDLRLERTATGVLIVNPPTGGETGRRNSSITGQLYRWFEAHKELGEIFDSSTGFTLPNGADRSPDAAWVSRSRWDGLTEDEKVGFIPLCPDFVVELRSKSDAIDTLRQKMKEYIDNGTQLGWLINPQNQTVDIYRPALAVELLDRPQFLSGEAILRGFVLDLQSIWS